ncbi:MAG: hypothetical protein ACI4HI_09900 [Lachnospiraceae bacterium]
MKQNLLCWCKDCNDQECLGAGKAENDCPKWKCDGDGDCEHCSFLQDLYEKGNKNGA